ncbi:MAG: hypothetical protein AAB890_02045, partial [Patescibacteria group bacterium]
VEDPKNTGQGVGICRSPKVNTCRDNACGNAKVETKFGEECDLGRDRNNKNLNTATSKCPFCKLARCGDGFVRAGVEQCDDGNLKDGDGCSAQCENENKCHILKYGCEDGKKCPLDYLCSGMITNKCYKGDCPFINQE